MQFGTGIHIKGAMSKGGYTSCRCWVVKNARTCSKHLRPKRSLSARLGHSKVTIAELEVILTDESVQALPSEYARPLIVVKCSRFYKEISGS